jgi:hypothetical protein
LYAEYYGGRMFWDVCYDGVLAKNPSGVTFRDLFHVLKMIMKRHKKMLKGHRDNGALVKHLEDFDEDTDCLEFYLEVQNTEGGVEK